MAEKTKTETKVVAEVPEKKSENTETVMYTLPRNTLTGPGETHKLVGINGKLYQVAVGKPVEVPVAVAKGLDDAIRRKYASEEIMDEYSRKASSHLK
jgi:hypothetical protein